jgi:hypothetical protein
MVKLFFPLTSPFFCCCFWKWTRKCPFSHWKLKWVTWIIWVCCDLNRMFYCIAVKSAQNVLCVKLIIIYALVSYLLSFFLSFFLSFCFSYWNFPLFGRKNVGVNLVMGFIYIYIYSLCKGAKGVCQVSMPCGPHNWKVNGFFLFFLFMVLGVWVLIFDFESWVGVLFIWSVETLPM